MELPLMLRLKGTVILTIWWQLIGVIAYTVGLLAVHNYVKGWEIKFPMTLVPVLGVVTGLLLVFRTNTAYDRYWEGRKTWSTMTWNIRTLTRCIWVGVEEKESTAKELVEKASAVNLLVAFAYATRNYLREKYSYEEDGVRELTSHIPRFSSDPPEQGEPPAFPSNSLKSSQTHSCSWEDVECRGKGSRVDSTTSKGSNDRRRTYNTRAYETSVPTNIPLELSFYISSYINSVRQQGLVDASTVTMMNNALNSLIDCLSTFERILRTPIPLAYSVHLHHATWLYLLALPYQLIGTLNWLTIPVVALASFALLGILGIGWEIENPFGYDDNDLPLDDFCRVIHNETLGLIGHHIPPPETWLLSAENHPLAPECYLTALDLSTMTESDVRNILARGGNTYLPSRNGGKGVVADLKVITGTKLKEGDEEILFIDAIQL